jgi:peptide deformylase
MILQYPNPILKKKAARVDPTASSTYSIVRRLKKIMEDRTCLGLAAPQIGISKQIAIASLIFPPETIVLINPVVLKRSMMTKVAEGCMSINGNYLATRPNKIVFKNFSRGKVETITKIGKIANVIDHEIDHLNGICGGRK